MTCCPPERNPRPRCTRRPGWPIPRWPACWSRAWPPRSQSRAPREPAFGKGVLVSTRTKGSSRSKTRLGVRYFDDRILLTDTYAWAYYRIPSVSYEFTTPEEREALATNITVALAAIRMQDAEVHLRIAHRSYPAQAWATGLAGLPGAVLPARLVQGLLGQGDLPRGPARPARRTRAVVRWGTVPVRRRVRQG